MFYGLPKNLVSFFRNEEIPETVTIYITKSAQSFESDRGKGKMGKRFSCSSIILAIHSERFKRIVSSGTSEIFLECFESPSEINTVKHIFEFMYGDRSAVNRAGDISVVLKFAQIWEVPSLWLACIDHIKSSLSSDPIKLFDYYKQLVMLPQSYEQLDELWREFNKVAQENADILIRYIMSAKGPKEVDFRILKELIENSKTAICGEYVSSLIKRGGDFKTFLMQNLHLIPVTTAFANEKELHEFKKLFNFSEWPELIPLIIKYEEKIGKHEPFVPVNNHSKVKKSKQKKKRGKPKNLHDLVTKSSKPFPSCSNTDITTSTLKNFDEEFMQDRAPCFSGNRLVELLDCSKKEAVKENWEDDSFDESDSHFNREAQDSIVSPSESVLIKSNDTKNVLDKHITSSKNWVESISQFHDEAQDWEDGTSIGVQIVIRRKIDLLLGNPNNMSLKNLIRASQKYSLFTRLEMLGLKLNNETKYGVSKLISILSPFFEDPRTPTCMLEDFQKLAIKSVLGNQEVLSQKLKEFSKKERKPTTVITQTFPCTLFLESVRSKGQISIFCKGPFKELIVDFSSSSYVKFSANPSKYKNYILHSYVLRLYDDGYSIITYVPILLLKVNDIQYLFETGKSSKFGSVRIVVVLSESIPANDGFYEGALVCNTLDC